MAFNNYDDEKLYQLVYKTTEEFYNLVYEDPWFKKIFRVIDQKIITSQQTDFMVQAMGGPKKYGGRTPEDAHPHIYIDEDMWQYREKLLKIAFEKCDTPIDIQNRWLKIDEAFKKMIIKNDISDCKKRFFTDEIIYEPRNKKDAA